MHTYICGIYLISYMVYIKYNSKEIRTARLKTIHNHPIVC